MSEVNVSQPMSVEGIFRLEQLAMDISAQAAILYGHLRQYGTNAGFSIDYGCRQSATLLADAIDEVRENGPINEVLANCAWISEIRPHCHGITIQFDREVKQFRDQLKALLEGESVPAVESPLFWRTLLVLVNAGVESDIANNMRYL